MIGRREFITLLGGAAISPSAARAQQPAMPVIAFLGSGASLVAPRLHAFRQGLKDFGYVEGENVAMEARWAQGQFDRLPDLAAELVRFGVAVIVTTGLGSALAAKSATSTVPIVFVGADNPVRFGLVASFNRPGGNATGLNLLTSELTAKRLELVRQLLPQTAKVAVLINPNSPEVAPQLADVQSASRAAGQPILILNVSKESDFDAAFAALAPNRADALLVTNDAFFFNRLDQIIAMAAHRAVPTIYDRREYAAAGGLISYGPNYVDAYRQAGIYAGRILKGEKPENLPVVQYQLGTLLGSANGSSRSATMRAKSCAISSLMGIARLFNRSLSATSRACSQSLQRTANGRARMIFCTNSPSRDEPSHGISEGLEVKRAISRARMSRSSTAGRKPTLGGCRHWRRTSLAVR
jgi:putative ABC transport system substrate-binding protein